LTEGRGERRGEVTFFGECRSIALFDEGFDEKLDEVVAFGGPGLRHMIMAIIAKSQDKPDTLYVFYFEPSPNKQETEVKDLKSAKQQKGRVTHHIRNKNKYKQNKQKKTKKNKKKKQTKQKKDLSLSPFSFTKKE